MKTEIHYVFTDYMGEIREMEIRRKYEASLNHSSCVSQILQSQLEKTQQLRTTLFNKLYAQSLVQHCRAEYWPILLFCKDINSHAVSVPK